jgi:hypothetical protein
MRAIYDYFMNGSIEQVISGIFVGIIIISIAWYWIKDLFFSKDED